MNAIAVRAPSLSALDWKVVDVARRDGRCSIVRYGRIERVARALFGLPITPGLANGRLEALRRFCVRAWYWKLIRDEDTRPAIEAGYAMPDLLEILAHIARRRGFAPRILQHNCSDRAWEAASPSSTTSSPALPALRYPSPCGQSHPQPGSRL